MEYWWVLWTGVYSLGLFWATWKWKGINANPTLLADFPTVSVLVPARNESNNLPKLLQSLSRQVYPSYWEVIVIDDHSEDNTVEVARSFQKGLELRAISLADTAWGQGKKAAITAGMDAASGDVVITTDADCWMDSGWLARMGSSFHSPSVQLAFGPVTFPVHNFWERWQALEFWSLIGIGAVTWQAKSPSMCNGANLAVRKEAFYEVGGYDASKDIPSGDDEFLLHAIVDRFGEKSTQFVKDKSALVFTLPSFSLGEFVQQRKRWASKWNLHKKLAPKLTALAVFGFHIGLLIGCLTTLTGFLPLIYFALGLLVKSTAEAIFLKSFSKTYDLKFPLMEFLCWQVLYSIYAVGIGLAVQQKKYQWKGRNYSSQWK